MNEKTRLILPLTLLSITAASLGGAAIVSLFLATKPVAVLVIGAFAMPAFFYLSGNPRLSTFWCMILSAPFSFGKDFMIVGHMGGAGAYTIELVDIFIVMMLVFIGRDFLLGYRRQIKLSWVVFYFGGCIALGLLTMAMGPYRNVAGHEVVRMLKGLLFFLVLVNELERPRQFLHVVGALMLGISLQSSVALVQFIKRGSLGLQVLGEAGDETLDYASQATYTGADTVFRVGGLLGHPTLLATFVAMLAPIGIALMLSRIKATHKAWITVATAMGGVALLLTLSRGGWVAFAAAFCVLLTLSFAHPRLRRRFLFTRVLMIAAVVVGGMAFSGPIMKRLTQSDPGAVNFRYEWNGVAWKMIKDKPILGFGLNSFVFNMAPYTVYGTPGRLTEKFGSNWPVVHNVYLLVWAEQGTVGFAFYLGLQFYLLYVGFRNLRIFKNEILFSINLGAIAGFVAVTLDGLASFYVRNPGCDRVYWVVAGLIIAVDFWNRQHANAPSLPANLPLEQRA